jgi:nucleotide-binding universal stress UspA family protein
MTRFKSILVATDFSPAAEHAIRRAGMLAAQHACPLTLLHVMNPAGSPALRRLFMRPIDLDLKRVQVRASLRRCAKALIARHGIAVTFDVVVGDATESILHASEHADLVVCGPHDGATLKDRVLAGTADRLVRTCRKPVLVVRQGAVDHPYRRVLVPVDFSACSEAALGLASSLSSRAEVHVFHVPEAEDADARARLHALAQQAGLEPDRVDISVDTGGGPAWRSALDQEQRLQADLIVAGKQGRSTLADFLLGSVARRLLAHARCDVLVLPRASAQAWRPAVAKAPSRPSPRVAAARDGAQQRLVWK